MLFQSFYGMPRKIYGKNGQRVEAAICFMGILRKTIASLCPDIVFVVFDGENHLERQDELISYKANRTDFGTLAEEDVPFSQLPLIFEMLQAYGIPFKETENEEADDFIAGLVRQYKNDYKIYISSGDKDFFQLIEENVSVFCYRGKVSKLWDVPAVQQKYGFSPQFFCTYKALVGDASDNIAGVKGIGQKTATKLICQYGSLQNILNNVKDQRLKKLLYQNKQQALLNFKLINLKDAKNKKLSSQDLCAFSNPKINASNYLKSKNIL